MEGIGKSMLTKDMKVSTATTVITEATVLTEIFNANGKPTGGPSTSETTIESIVNTSDRGELATQVVETVGDNPNGVPALSFQLSSSGKAYKWGTRATSILGGENSVSKAATNILDAQAKVLNPAKVTNLKNTIEENKTKVVD